MKFFEHILKGLMLMFTALLTASLFFAACRTTKSVNKEVTRELGKDSFHYREIANVNRVFIPMAKADMVIPVKLLTDSNYRYAEKSNGRAKVVFEKHGTDSITITAHCDSLEQVIVSKDKEIYQLQKQQLEQIKDKQVTVVVKRTWFERLILWACALFVLLQGVQFILKFLKTPIWQKLLAAVKAAIKR
jgi:hypothetical protein